MEKRNVNQPVADDDARMRWPGQTKAELYFFNGAGFLEVSEKSTLCRYSLLHFAESCLRFFMHFFLNLILKQCYYLTVQIILYRLLNTKILAPKHVYVIVEIFMLSQL